ncbi:MAG: protein kinase [Zavarzinella sp.]
MVDEKYPKTIEDSSIPEGMPVDTEQTLQTSQEATGGKHANIPIPEYQQFLNPPLKPDELGRLGSYRVLQLLGQGGMGLVFLGHDPALNRKVALKVMRPDVATNPTAAERFIREAQAAASIKHDNIITIYQVNQSRGIPFIALEFLKGEALDDRLKKMNKLPPNEVARIGYQTALGLAAAHDEGLIHRDIKPANIWLEAPSDRVKILDFGLARSNKENIHLTHSGAVVGTPAYMSPEQANGGEIDHRSDLFSLGAMLYRLSTGKLPFRGDTMMAMLMSLAMEEPEHPHLVNPNIPPTLSVLIMRLLAKKPEDRIQTAKEVAKLLAPSAPTVKIVVEPLPVMEDRSVFDFDSGVEHLPVAPAKTEVTKTKPKSNVRQQQKFPILTSIISFVGLIFIVVATWQVIIRITDKNGKVKEIVVAPDEKIEILPGTTDNKPANPILREPVPEIAVPLYDDGESPLDNLDPEKIPAEEKFDWQPKELVAIVGTHQQLHWGAITDVAYSPKGDLIASVAADGVRLWDAQTMTERALLPPGYAKQNLCFSPDGKKLSWYQHDGSAIIYDVSVNPPKEYGRIAGYCARQPFAPDGKYFLLRDVKALPHRYEIWDISGEKPVRMKIITEFVAENNHWAVGANRFLDISATTVRLIDCSTEKPVINQIEGDLHWFTVSKSGKWCAYSSQKEKKIVIYNISNGKFEKTNNLEWPQEFEPSNLRFQGDSELWFAHGVIWQCYHLRTSKTISLSKERLYGYGAFDFAPSGKEYVITSEVGSGILMRVEITEDGAGKITHQLGEITKTVPVPSAHRILTVGSTTPVVHRWDLDGLQPKRVPIPGGGVNANSITSLVDGQIVRIGDFEGSLFQIDPTKGNAADPTVIEHGVRGIGAVSVSPAKRWLAVASWMEGQRSPAVFDFRVNPPKLIAELKEYPENHNAVQGFLFSPNEQFLVAIDSWNSGFIPKMVIWDLRGPRIRHVATLEGVISASFAVDSTMLITGSTDGKVKLFDYASGQLLEKFAVQPFTGQVQSAILLPGGQSLLASDATGSIKFMKLPFGDIEREWKFPGMTRLHLSPDGRHIYTENSNGTCYVLRMAPVPATSPSPLDALERKAIPAAELVPELPQDAVAVIGSHAGKHWGGVNSMACTPDGSLVVTAGVDGIVKLFDPVARKELATLRDLPRVPHSVALSADGKTLAVAGAQGGKVYSVNEARLTVRLQLPTVAYSYLTMTPDGKRLALVEATKTSVVDITDRLPRQVSTCPTPTSSYSPVFLQDGKMLATSYASSGENFVHVWDTASGKQLHKFGSFEHGGSLTSFRDGQALVFGESDGTLRTWDFSAGVPKETSRKLASEGPPMLGYISISADGKKLFDSSGSAVQFWDLASASNQRAWFLHLYYPQVAISADGKVAFATENSVMTVGAIDTTDEKPEWKPLLEGITGQQPFGISPSGQVISLMRRNMLQYENNWLEITKGSFGKTHLEERFPAGNLNLVWFPADKKSRAMFTTSNNTEVMQYDLSQPLDAAPIRKVVTGGQIWSIHGSADASTFTVTIVSGKDIFAAIYRPTLKAFEEVARVPLTTAAITRLSADGKALYQRDQSGHVGTLHQWDLSGKDTKEIKLPAGFENISNWDISADGRRMITMSGTGATIWDITGPAPRSVCRLTGLAIGGHWTLAISPDGRQFVVGGLDISASPERFWYGLYDSSTGTKRREWVFPHAVLFQFTHDGRHLLTANTNGTSYVICIRRGPTQPPVKQ